MDGLNVKVAQAIEQLIDKQFNGMSLKFLGLIPKISREKKIVFTTNKNSLTSLFLQALGSRNPNKVEEDTLKVILRIANGYVESLKERTKARILNGVDSALKEGGKNRIKTIFNKEMNKAKNHLKLIANNESTKTINTGSALQISKVAESRGISDPIVFFVVTIDDRTGFYEFILHLLPDGKTPRVWKLSELIHDYYQNGGQWPSIQGLHPNCRCRLTMLMPNWGFNEGGNVKFKGIGWDEFKYQREKYGLPDVPSRPRKKSGKWALPSNLQKAYQDHLGKWRFDISDEHGMEHPENNKLSDKFDHQIAHKTNSGKLVWKPKHLQWGGREVTPDMLDSYHRNIWKDYSKNIGKGTPLRNTLVSLNKEIINDKDRHLRLSGTSGHKDPNHTELRQRHLIHAMANKPGYSIEEVNHPESGQHMGIRIKAPRHPNGQKYETSWFYDGKNLKTEYDKKI